MTPRIIFYCFRSLEPWAPPSLATGIGGSETAVIKIADHFARAGWRVDVYNDADRFEGEYNGVGYWDLNRVRADERCDVLVIWRQPAGHGIGIKRRATFLWLHDLNSGPDAGDHFAWYDQVLGVSAWHAAMLRSYYPLAPNIDYVPNGIDLADFDPAIRKAPWRCVYASSPDRGLSRLLHQWPKVLEAEPEAELHVAYGWQNIDKLIGRGDRPDLEALKENTVALLEKTPRVVWRERLGQGELARLFSESVLWTYPTTFLETSCIGAMSAMAGGAVPVCPPAGALKETVGSGGLLVPGMAYSQRWQDSFVQAVRGLFTDAAARARLLKVARVRAEYLTWDLAFERWQAHVAAALDKNGHEPTLALPTSEPTLVAV